MRLNRIRTIKRNLEKKNFQLREYYSYSDMKFILLFPLHKNGQQEYYSNRKSGTSFQHPTWQVNLSNVNSLSDKGRLTLCTVTLAFCTLLVIEHYWKSQDYSLEGKTTGPPLLKVGIKLFLNRS